MEVEMMCYFEGSKLRVYVASEGPFKGWMVRCSKSARIVGAKYKGKVVIRVKKGAPTPCCDLVKFSGTVDFDVFVRI